ncbi:MAG: site-specific DNA-methyltransferase [Candidatus Gracilibacteria bacterium]|nr:site-specific DNA-methyltransferase [Candidatus Gracilibacteria bacterium]
MNPEELKQTYFKIRSSSVEHLKDLIHDLKGNKSDELNEKIRELEQELENLKNTKKYGLVWDSEKEHEQVVLDCQTKLPILKEEKTRKIINDNSGDSNLLIEGDNYHALQVLNYTHKEAIDVIYIDPPYNTGNKDFIYNDKYIDKEDTYRHSKWLNFMDKRLRLAHNLLKEDGVIFISIDDNEQAQLKLLCDEIFGEENFVAKIIWKKKQGGGNDSTHIVVEHEYIYIYSKVLSKLIFNLDSEHVLSDSLYPFKDEKGEYGLVTLDKTSIRFSQSLVYEIIDKNGNIYLPRIVKGRQSCWRWGKEKVKNEFDSLVFKDGKVYTKYYRPEGVTPKSLLYDTRFGRTETGKELLIEILGRNSFSYPKPLELLKHLLRISTRDNSLVADFMAGSGTTGHAVLDLNKEDGGNRKFILCTNNENNICEEITYERIKRVSNGYTNSKGKEIEGLGGNLRYYKTDFVEIESLKEITDKQKLELTYNAGELLAIKEGIYNELEKNDFWQIFENKTEIVAIYFKESTRKVQEMKERLKEIQTKKGGKVKWYIYNNPFDKTDFKDLKGLELKDIPDPILKVYREINRV